MASRQDYWEFFDDFIGAGATFPTSADNGNPWVVTDTSAAGTPTYTYGVDTGTSSTGAAAAGIAKLDLEATSEVQNVCLSFGGAEQFDLTDKIIYECRLKMNQSAAVTGTTFSFGICAGRNATWESTTVLANFQILAATSTTVVYVETDDNVTDTAPVSTGYTLINAYKYFKIDLTNLSSVKFYMTDGNSKLVRVCGNTTFDLSGYTGCIEPIFQLQKSASTNTDGVSIDYVRLTGRRVS